jgi:hypothetical protein
VFLNNAKQKRREKYSPKGQKTLFNVGEKERKKKDRNVGKTNLKYVGNSLVSQGVSGETYPNFMP